MEKKQKYGCADYRDEMTLLGLKKRLRDPGLTEAERKLMESQIEKLEKEMKLD